MPWQLTTPVTVGDLDPNGPYGEVKIMRQVHDARRKLISIDLEYGNTVDGEWVRGIPPADKTTSHVISGDAYDTMVTTHATNDGELTYDACKRGLYEHLSTEGVIDAGSVS
jgi:hypothetical protein